MNLSDQGLRRRDPTPVVRILTATAAEVGVVAALALAVLFTTAPEQPFDVTLRFVAVVLGLGTGALALGAWATAKARGLWQKISRALKLAIFCLTGTGLALPVIALAA